MGVRYLKYGFYLGMVSSVTRVRWRPDLHLRYEDCAVDIESRVQRVA